MSNNIPPKKIVLVEDESNVREIFSRVLRGAGFDVMDFASAAGALPYIDTADVVVSDLDMSPHDGLWLLDKLKERFPHKKFILVSGSLDREKIALAHEKGIWGFLRKPCNINELVDIVQECLHGSN